MIIYIIFYHTDIIKEDKDIFLIFSIILILDFLNIDWFFQGIEDYRYITIRTIFIKIISLFFIFCFIKKEKDIYLYVLILVFSSVVSSLFNIIKIIKLVEFKLKNLKIKKHLKDILIIFSMNLAISIYTNLDSVMLGGYGNKYSLGIYSAANKIIVLIMGIVTSLGTVTLPRISNYIAENKENEIKLILKKMISFLCFFIFPSVMGIYFTANEIILLFAGREYLEAVTTLKILSLTIIFIGFSNLIGLQIFYPRGKEKIVFYSVTIGAILNFSLNLYLIPKYFQNGAAIATCIAEFGVLIVQIILGYRYLKLEIFDKNNLKFIISTCIMGIILYFIQILKFKYLVLKLLLKIILGVSIYLVSLVLLKEKNITDVIIKIKLRINKLNQKER